MIRRVPKLDHAANFGDGLAMGDQLLGGFELANDLLLCMPGPFHGKLPAQSGRTRMLIEPGPISRLHFNPEGTVY